MVCASQSLTFPRLREGKSNGVLALMDMLVKELKDELTEATHDEETGPSASGVLFEQGSV